MAQSDSLVVKADTLKVSLPWEQKNKINLDLNEVAFVNWNSGGSKFSISIVRRIVYFKVRT